MDEFVIYHVPREENLKANLWLSKHLVIMFRKEIFRKGNRCLVKLRVTF
jgi:hypothetical protein